MKKTVNLLKITIFVIIIAAVALSAALSLAQTAYAETISYKLSFTQPTDFFTRETGYTLQVEVPDALYDAYELKITYQRVELNEPALDKVESYVADGAITTDKFVILDEKGTIAAEKGDIKTSGSKKYFEVTTKENCAYIFTIERKDSATDEEIKTGETQIIYFRKIDYAAPTFAKTNTVWQATGMKASFIVYDDKETQSAMSGIRTVKIYENGEEEPVFEKEYSSEGRASSGYLSHTCEYNKRYYIEMTDFAGNTSGKREFAYFENDVYNAVAEADAENAINDLGGGKYTNIIMTTVTRAYAEYLVVTRDETKTEEEKQAALNDLNEAIALYNAAKKLYDNGNGSKITLDIEVVNGESAQGLTIVGAEAGLSFLKIGDNAKITLSAANYTKTEFTRNETLLKEADDDMKSADEAYVIAIKTVSDEEGEIRKEFASAPEIRFMVGETEKIAAVQTVYTVTGGVKYYRCVVVKHVDGTVSVATPHTGGTVTVFVVREHNDLYWLFSLTAIPLVVGAAMLIYAFRKMKKVKENALNEKNEENTEQAEEKTAKKTAKNIKNKKKKKKKK